MLRSLFTGISGLKAHQQMMDVTGNNISNANTTGFKSSSTQFQDTLSQMLTAAAMPTADRGGSNPAQVGLGVRVSGVNSNFGQGVTQMTGRSLDMLIDGNGFFVVAKGAEQMYTRAGSFTLDANGALVTQQGDNVQGYAPGAGPGSALQDLRIADDPVEGRLQSFTIGPDGVIGGIYASGNRVELGTVALARFANPGGLEKTGNSMFRATVNSGAGADNPDLGAPGGAFGTITTGALEMSNVDLATEFTNMIISQRGFQANSKIISTSDEILQELVNMKR